MGLSVFPAALPALFGELWACLLRSSSPSSSKASYTIYHQGTSDCMTSLVLIFRQGLSSLKWLARAITQILRQTFVTAYRDDLCIYHCFLFEAVTHTEQFTRRKANRAITHFLPQTLVTLEIGFENCCRRKD